MDTDIINNVITAAQTAGAGLRGTLLPMALPLLWVIFAIVVTWTFLGVILGDSFETGVVDALRTVIMVGFISMLLTAWVTPLPGTSFSVSGFFIDGFEDIKTTIMGSNSIDATLNRLMRGIHGMGTTATPNCAEGLQASDVTCIPSAGSTLEGNTAAWLLASPVKFVDFIFAGVMRFIAFLLAIAMLIYFVCVIVLSSMAVEIGLILGPIMVPFLLWKPASFLFDGWLKYAITASLYNVVAAIVLVFVSGMVVALDSVRTVPVSAVAISAQVQLPIAIGTMLVTACGLYLMMQVQSITGMLMGGGGVDLSPRFGRAAAGALRLAKGGGGGGGTPAATPSTPSRRLGQGGAGTGSPAAQRARSDAANGAFGRGKSSPTPPRSSAG